MENIKHLSSVRVGEKIKIIDEDLLAKLPRLKNRELICSVVKQSGRRLFFQYFSPETGSGTLKVTSDPQVQVLSKEDILTLANFIAKYRYQDNLPKKIEINSNGELSVFELAEGFFNQNAKNIYIKFLKRNGSSWRMPGSSIVKQVIQ